jgi:hypothetical protein
VEAKVEAQTPQTPLPRRLQEPPFSAPKLPICTISAGATQSPPPKLDLTSPSEVPAGKAARHSKLQVASPDAFGTPWTSKIKAGVASC